MKSSTSVSFHVLLFLASCLSSPLSAQQQIITQHFFNDVQCAKLECAPSSGKPVLAGEAGVIAIFSDAFTLERYERIPTVSNVVAIEPTQTGFLALTDGLQVFRRQNSVWTLERSFFSTRRALLDVDHYAMQIRNVLTVYENETGSAVEHIALPIETVSVFKVVDDTLVTMADESGMLYLYNRNTNTVDSIRIDEKGVVSVSRDGQNVLLVGTEFKSFHVNLVSKTVMVIDPKQMSIVLPDTSINAIKIMRTVQGADSVYRIAALLRGNRTIGQCIISQGGGNNIFAAQLVHSELFSFEPSSVFVADGNSILRGGTDAGSYLTLGPFANGTREWTLHRSGPYGFRFQSIALAGANDAFTWVSNFRRSPTEGQDQYRELWRVTSNAEVVVDSLPVDVCSESNSDVGFAFSSPNGFYIGVGPDSSMLAQSVHGPWACAAPVQGSTLASAKGNSIAVAPENTVMVSTNGGLQWLSHNTSVQTSAKSALVIDPLTVVGAVPGAQAGSVVYSTTDGGVTWRDVEIADSVQLVIHDALHNVVFVNRQTGSSGLRIKLTGYNIDNNQFQQLMDTTLLTSAVVYSGLNLNGKHYLIATDEIGIVKVSNDWRSLTIDTSATLRIPSNGTFSVSNTIASANAALYKARNGASIMFKQEGGTGIDVNEMQQFVGAVWPTPAFNTINCRMFIPSSADLVHATAMMYDHTGAQVLDLTNALHHGTLVGSWVEFRESDIRLTSGSYVLVVHAGQYTTSKNVLIVR